MASNLDNVKIGDMLFREFLNRFMGYLRDNFKLQGIQVSVYTDGLELFLQTPMPLELERMLTTALSSVKPEKQEHKPVEKSSISLEELEASESSESSQTSILEE